MTAPGLDAESPPAQPGSTARVAPSTEPGSSHLFGRGLLYVVVWSFQLVAGTIVSPVLAHVMGPAEFGALASALALHQVLSVIALMGLDQAVVLQRAEDGHDRSARALATVGIVIAAVVTTIVALTAHFWLGAVGLGDYPSLVFAVVLWTAPAAAVQVTLALLLAEDRLGPFALVSGLAAVGGQAGGLVLLLVVRNDAATYALGSVASQSVAMVIGIIVTRPPLRGLREWRIAWRGIRLGIPLALGALAYFVLNAGDRIIIQRMLGSEQVGRYQIAYVVGSVVILLLTFTSSAWTPRFAALRGQAERWALALHSRDELYRLLMPMIMGITLAAPVLLRIVAPASFEPESLTLVVLVVALSAFPVAASGATGRILITLRRGKTLGLIAGIAAVVNVILNLILVPIMGIVGAAGATLASYAILAFLQEKALPRQHAWRGPSVPLFLSIVATMSFTCATVLVPQTDGWNAARVLVGILCLPWFIFSLRRARRGSRVPGPSGPPTDANAKETTMTISRPAKSGPKPVRILALDLDEPIPSIAGDGRCETALVVGWKAGIPVGVVDVDLLSTDAPAQAQLEPLVRMAAERPDPGPRIPDANLPSISVVIPTVVARVDDLALLLEGLDRVDYPNVEYILVDNRRSLPDDDHLPGLVAGRRKFRTVRAARPGISAARNAGVEAARGDIVAFTDDDVRVDTNWLRALASRYVLDPGLQAVTGLILPAELETPAQIWFEQYYGGFSGERTFAPLTLALEYRGPRAVRRGRVTVRNADHERVRSFSMYGIGAYGAGANMSFRRSALNRVNGFDTALGTGTAARGGEDLATLISILWAGGSIGYEPAAVVHHRHRREVPELIHQLRGNGIGFTAMLTSLITHDRRHALSLGGQLPLAVWRMLGQNAARIARRPATTTGAVGSRAQSRYPRSLVTNEMRSYLRGPAAYFRSRRADRAWAPTPGAEAPPMPDRQTTTPTAVGTP